ncbi:nitroreductase family protein [Providencia stuartii]|uniref:nitroreductase family protein n=1 Tax=Providencia stuartii TaxID=588 RepID=UPI0018C82FB8|nr:nitroreductase family protein [Providencia stuartii]MBG5898363.1 nitroreductase family protein [Providencia stuartii]MDT7052194.1 nitroreductase family protein [Providencia stuartii]
MKKFLKKIKYNIKCLNVFFNDFSVYIKNTGNSDLESLIYKLRKDYHKIEKGLTLKPRKDFFGKKVIYNIILNTQLLISKSPHNEEISNVINVLTHYLNAHNNAPQLDYIKEFINKNEVKITPLSSPLIINPSITDKCRSSYAEVLKTRKSVRYYQNKLVDIGAISASVELATLTPSVCNRQSWRVHLIQNKNIINKLLSLQNGNTGFGNAVQNLIIITGCINSCLSPKERNQLWFDSGLFSMNLVNSLHSNNIASCFLNWCEEKDSNYKIQKILNIPPYEIPTVYISLGYYEQDTEVCHSPRKSIINTLKIHN